MSPTRKSIPLPGESLDAIEQAAAEWLLRRDRGLTPAQADELANWRQADPRRAAAFGALEQTWHLLGEAQREPESSLRPARRFGRWILAGLAAAAVLALSATGWWYVGNSGPVRERTVYSASEATAVGALRTLALPDGSVVQLNTASSVDVQFTPAVRRVHLRRGEAHFAVAHDTARPFVVTVGGMEVCAVGTAFNVRLRSESIDVLVTEGKVRIDPPAAPAPAAPTPPVAPLLEAGHQLTIALPAAARRTAIPARPQAVAAATIKQTLAWQQRRLEFNSAPLAEMVAEINRYNRHQLIIADARLETRRFGGSFPAGEYATFVRLLEREFGVVSERRADRTFLRLAPPR